MPREAEGGAEYNVRVALPPRWEIAPQPLPKLDREIADPDEADSGYHLDNAYPVRHAGYYGCAVASFKYLGAPPEA